MHDKIEFLFQVYFLFSFICTFVLLCDRLPEEIRLTKKYKRTYKDNLVFIRNVIILLIGFPIIAMYYGIKEF